MYIQAGILVPADSLTPIRHEEDKPCLLLDDVGRAAATKQDRRREPVAGREVKS